ncbi:MAG: hypothetical protein KDA62_14105, partial [Planctomycetales bacterium]|nr:hypothetical protein [Planctomycetales bacterium]
VRVGRGGSATTARAGEVAAAFVWLGVEPLAAGAVPGAGPQPTLTRQIDKTNRHPRNNIAKLRFGKSYQPIRARPVNDHPPRWQFGNEIQRRALD